MNISSAAVARPVVLGDALPAVRGRDVALVVGGAGLVAIAAQIAIEVPPSPVPVTAQTLAVVLVGASLGSARGTLSLLLYLVAGLMLPIYSEGGSGWDHVTGASGGYLIGFLLAAWVVGRLAEAGSDRTVLVAFATFVLGQLLVFGIGVPWLKASTGMDWSTAIHDGFSIFVVGGLVKAALAGVLLPSAWRLVRRLDGKQS